MYNKVVILSALALCAWASPLPQSQQQAADAGQPQQQYDPQLLAYIQQLQAQQQQQQQLQPRLQQQQPQLFQQAQPQAAPQQSQPQQYQQQQVQPALQLQRQQFAAPQIPQQPQQSLLGVAYSSAADASKASFSGYGISYNF